MTRHWFILLLTALSVGAQVKTPPIGIARFADESVRQVSGLPDNLIVSSQSFGSFDAASFSDEAGLVAKAGLIRLVTPAFTTIGEYRSVEPHPVLSVDADASTATAWLPATQTIVRWNGSAFQAVNIHGIDSAYSVSALRLTNASTAELLMAGVNGDVFSAAVSLKSGDLLSLASLPGVRGAAFWQGARILYQNAGELVAVSLTGTTTRIAAINEPVAFERISSTWVLARSAHHSVAVHVANDRIHASEIPAEVGQ